MQTVHMSTTMNSIIGCLLIIQDYKLAETNQSLVNEIEKNQKELDRLRNHLLMVEEQHTNEQLQANDRESQLRIQMKIMEDKISKQDQRLAMRGGSLVVPLYEGRLRSVLLL